RLVRRLHLQRHRTLALHVLEGRVDSNRVAKLHVLTPQNRFRAAELGETPKRRRVEARIGGNVQVPLDLAEAIEGNRSKMRRLSDLGSKHLGQVRTQPIDRLVRRRIPEW